MDTGAQYLFAGITGGAKSLADTIEEVGQRHRQLKAYQSLGQALGWDPKEMEHMSPEDFTGRLQAMAVRKELTDLGLNQTQTERLQQLIAQRKEQVAAGKTFREAVQRYTRPRAQVDLPPIGQLNTTLAEGGSPVTVPPRRQLDPETIAELGLTSGMEPEQLAPLVGALDRVRGRSGEDFVFDPTAGVVPLPGLPGRTFVRTSKGGGQIVEDPEAIAAAAAAREGAKRKPSGIRFKAVPSLTDPSGYATSVESDTPEGLQEGMRLLKGAAAAPAAGGDVLPLPKTKAELKEGKTYQTRNGPAVWDGSLFQPAGQ